jgi:acetyl-CoA carboxylase carboxyltransferase component
MAGAASDLGAIVVRSPVLGTLVAALSPGEVVGAGQVVAVVESMKLEHAVACEVDGVVLTVSASTGEVLQREAEILTISPTSRASAAGAPREETDPDEVRGDLAEVIAQHELGLDEARPAAVARRRERGQRTARENVARLVDPGTFVEYWPLVVAHQHQRRGLEELQRDTTGDGVLAGTATINADLFGPSTARAVVVHYDYMVLAGTQGIRGHHKLDRMIELARRERRPMVLFAEGGGGRPGDDHRGPEIVIDVTSFTTFARLSALVPVVAVVSGYCFAGNAALAACADVVIATRGATLAMGGPAMIEGGGLGRYTPDEIAPMSTQVPNGVVDLLVDDEDAAVDAARRYLSYFQGPVPAGAAADQRRLRHVVPESRRRAYDMREVVRALCDEGSVMELREAFGRGIVTALARVAGHAVGVVANDPTHLGGALDADGSDKAARFLALCDAFELPVLSLVDCPGFMVGPDAEREGLVRHAGRLFAAGANLTSPLYVVIVRNAVGLGAQAMSGGHVGAGRLSVAWPTAEFAGMNLEGAIRLGFRRELAEIADDAERQRWFDERVARAHANARAAHAAIGGGVDDVIDPAATRQWLISALAERPTPAPRAGKRRPYVDPW